jgi:3-hydroxybutyryl-CoA dehydrogenase
MTLDLRRCPVLVVGAGLMGTGIAQVAAQAGHPVWLVDARPDAAAAAHARLGQALDALAAKGRLTGEQAAQARARVQVLAALPEAAGLGIQLAVEAIVEDLPAKRALFAELEALLGDDAVLASNTSSISLSAIAAGLRRPERVLGMHFFNPVPVMKLVEVVSGLQTAPAVAQAVQALAQAWGKTAVLAQSTPGFIVNRIARPYYAEAWALLLERAASPAVLDACLRGAGFRMGPCELMDLIGHDTNLAVTRSVYDAFFQDKRYLPSVLQAEMVAGGLLGRKSGRGFYAYPEGPPLPPPADPALAAAALRRTRAVTVHGKGPVAQWLAQRSAAALAPHGLTAAVRQDSGWTGLEVDGTHLLLTCGLTAQEWAAETGIDEVAVFDRPVACLRGGEPGALAWAPHAAASSDTRARAAGWLAALGFMPQEVADTPGLLVARTVAMLVNEAADAVLQGVCTETGADTAMTLGLNYPAGPFEWLADWRAREVVALLDALDGCYRGERYRASPALQRRARLEPAAR